MNDPASAPKPGHKAYITLQGETYQVRVKDRQRQIFYADEWHDALEFPDWLREQGKFDALCDLILVSQGAIQ